MVASPRFRTRALVAPLVLLARARGTDRIADRTAPAVERWGLFELTQTGPTDSPAFNAFSVLANVTFTHVASGERTVVNMFYDGDGAYVTRFSPPLEGAYDYASLSSSPAMPPQHGSFAAAPPSPGNHGPVRTDPLHPRAFAFADGTPHVSVGTTAYAWMHVSDANANATLATLAASRFNKLRMTLFPKHYPWTHTEPPTDFFAFARAAGAPPPCTICCPALAGSFDLTRFHPPFWRAVDGYVRAMQAAGVVADIILFHPYDGGAWGFDCMGMDADLRYVRYAAARLGAYANVWWSMANEWSDLKCKCDGRNSSACPEAYFDTLFGGLVAADAHARQRSIHNGPIHYNHSQPWIDHVSMQCHGDAASGRPFAAGSECVDLARATWTPKPVVMDEVRYEGNISAQWGQLTAEDMAQRFWLFFAKGAYCGHSETVLPAVWAGLCGRDANACLCSPDMWWNHGGGFAGGSAALVAFFRGYAEALPVHFSDLESEALVPGVFWLRSPDAARTYSLVLWDETVLNASTPALVPLPAGAPFRARQIDIVAGSFVDLGVRVGPLAFAPPTPGFVLELVPAPGLGARDRQAG